MLRKEHGLERKLEDSGYKLQESHNPTNQVIYLPDGQSIYVPPEEYRELGREGCMRKYNIPIGNC